LGLPFHKEPDQQMIHYTVEAILKGLKSNDNEVLNFIYRKYFPEIRFFVIKNSGSDEDAQDVFQEAIIIIYKKLRDGVLDLTCSFKTYLYSVCRIVWLKQLEKRKIKKDGFSDNQVFVDLQEGVDEMAEEQERYKLYQKHFQTLHVDCQTILKLFLEKVPLKEIANRMNINSEKYLKKRKFQCKEILVKRIQNDPNFKKLKDDY
jgi:RNA polymerase sigma factor (sigma-70 family)